MPASQPEIRVEHPVDDTLVVEAPSAELALAEVTSTLGASARIVGAEKVLRGGVAGFFAREVVQLRARRVDSPEVEGPEARGDTPETGAAAAAVATRTTGEAAAAGDPGALDQLLARLRAGADADERSFADVLRAQLSPAELGAASTSHPDPGDALPQPARTAAPPPAPALPAVLPPVPAPVPPAPVPPAAVPPSASPTLTVASAAANPAAALAVASAPAPGAVEGGPAWSVANLLRLGLPPLVIDAVRGLDGRDDLTWFSAVAAAVAPLCRPLPTGAQVLTGPRATRLAAALGVAVADAAADALPVGDVAVNLRDSGESRSWLAWARQDRWLHLAVGGDGWRGLLFDEPDVLSWVGADALPAALSTAANLGLALGYGVDPKSGPATRARPVDVALVVRALLPQR